MLCTRCGTTIQQLTNHQRSAACQNRGTLRLLARFIRLIPPSSPSTANTESLTLADYLDASELPPNSPFTARNGLQFSFLPLSAPPVPLNPPCPGVIWTNDDGSHSILDYPIHLSDSSKSNWSLVVTPNEPLRLRASKCTGRRPSTLEACSHCLSIPSTSEYQYIATLSRQDRNRNGVNHNFLTLRQARSALVAGRDARSTEFLTSQNQRRRIDKLEASEDFAERFVAAIATCDNARIDLLVRDLRSRKLKLKPILERVEAIAAGAPLSLPFTEEEKAVGVMSQIIGGDQLAWALSHFRGGVLPSSSTNRRAMSISRFRTSDGYGSIEDVEFNLKGVTFPLYNGRPPPVRIAIDEVAITPQPVFNVESRRIEGFDRETTDRNDLSVNSLADFERIAGLKARGELRLASEATVYTVSAIGQCTFAFTFVAFALSDLFG